MLSVPGSSGWLPREFFQRCIEGYPSQHDSTLLSFTPIDIYVYIILQGYDVGYIYCNYEAKGYLKNVHHATPFDADRLRKNNFASTMSIIKAEAVPEPPFIEDEDRLQDWSLWLRLLNAGYRGVYIPIVGFIAHYNEASISSRGYDDYLYWKQIIRKRYVFND